MVKSLTITIADQVYNEITKRMPDYAYSNRSEFVEELIRLGLIHWDKNYKGLAKDRRK